MLDCKKFHAKLNDWYDCKLDPVEQRQMEAHWISCKSCWDAKKKKLRDIFCTQRSLLDLEILQSLEGCLSKDTLLEYLADSLTRGEADYVRRHIEREGCVNCALRLEKLRRIISHIEYVLGRTLAEPVENIESWIL